MLGTTVALGLGSNLGNSIEYLRLALARIKGLPEFYVQNVSSIFESDALTPADAPAEWNKKYLNAVVLVFIEGRSDPSSWLRSLKKIESEIGRKSGDVWAPREIDIDILYWSDEPLKSADLSIPHARLTERPFALLPLLQVWPEVRNRIQLPEWAEPWRSDRPFKTQISSKVWPRLVGILNLTPDSFSDGGRWLNEKNLEQQLQNFSDHEVDIVDIGAESTRPNASVVTLEEEYDRLQGALEILKATSFRVSLDCRRGEVVERVLAKHSIEFLNDVTGFESPIMKNLLNESGLKAFVMHSLGVPPTKEAVIPKDQSPFMVLTKWWKKKKEELLMLGCIDGNLIFDPGISFGKTPEQSFYILNHLEEFAGIKNEMMIGHSRKSFLSKISNRPAADRDAETAMVTQNLNPAYVQYLRIHDPASQLAALRANGYLC